MKSKSKLSPINTLMNIHCQCLMRMMDHPGEEESDSVTIT